MAHEHLGAPSAPNTLPPSVAVPAIFSPTELRASSAADAPAPLSSYVMLRQAAPLEPSAYERADRSALEVTVLWGTNVIAVFHFDEARAFFIGDEPSACPDFLMPSELFRGARFTLAELVGGRARLSVPRGAELSLRSGSAEPSAVVDALAADAVTLASGSVGDVRIGALIFRVSAVSAGKSVPRAVGADARGLGASFLISLTAVGAFLGAMAYYTPALGASLGDELNRDQLALMQQYLKTQAERELRESPADAGQSSSEKGGERGEAARGEQGAMGRPNQPVTNRRVAIAGTGERQLSREAALVEARTIGMVGLLNSMNAFAGPTALWGADVPNGPDSTTAWGNMFGEEIGESGGSGGLSLSVPGSGGGGRGDWIGLGGIGTCGTNCGLGTGPGGFGSGFGHGKRGHVARGPSVRPAGETILGGHLPPELIQRVVRQNFGRFRQCYESALRANPNLTGRVTARFVIDRDGSVSNVANGGSDLPDSGAVQCVVSAFYGLSFPAPKDGVVRVSYPILFTPS
jgi:hypothetical protein